jgi:hypothetical protein
MSVAAVNSFIFEIIYCKRQTKNASKAMADSCDICTNRHRCVAVTLAQQPLTGSRWNIRLLKK